MLLRIKIICLVCITIALYGVGDIYYLAQPVPLGTLGPELQAIAAAEAYAEQTGKELVYIPFQQVTPRHVDVNEVYYITNTPRPDGFGAQFQTIIAAMIYAELAGKYFVYTPFQNMEHNYDNAPDFLARKEWLINFIGNVPLNESSAYIAADYIEYFDTHIPECATSNALKQIKKIFRANKKRPTSFGTTRFNIAVHVRRPNKHDSRVIGTDTKDAVFLGIIDALRMRYRDKNPLFHLYSQGDASQFSTYDAPDVRLCLNESIEDTFIGMVFADALVTSASSFSYVAALISDGDIYYMPFWHKPLPHWLSTHSLLARKLPTTPLTFERYTEDICVTYKLPTITEDF